VPRALHINTGPSRTGDIEQTIEIGAHGPRRMHVLIVSG
jgi:L-lactate dehydrogenase complex protein LldG